MVIISVSGNGNVKTCCQEVIIQLRQTRDSRRQSEMAAELKHISATCNMLPAAVAVVVAVVVVVVVIIVIVAAAAAAEGLHRINVVLQHVGHKNEKLLPRMLHCVM